jgi:hypothetical protein
MRFQAVFSMCVIIACLWIGASGCTIAEDPVIERLSSNGAFDWFSAPKAVSIDDEDEKSYIQWVSSSGRLYAASYSHETRGIQTVAIKDEFEADDRNCGSWLVLTDNRLAASYSQLSGDGIYCRLTVNDEDISEWEDEVAVVSDSGATGPQPLYLSDERLYYVFYADSAGYPAYVTSEDLETWSEPIQLITLSTEPEEGKAPNFRVKSDGKSDIHIVISSGHPDTVDDASLAYFRYRDGVFYSSTGGYVVNVDSLPIAFTALETVYNGASSGPAWLWDLALDGSSPVLAFVYFQSNTDHRYCYAKHIGSGWNVSDIVRAGSSFVDETEDEEQLQPLFSGGLSINHNAPGTVYLSRKDGDYFEIQRWKTGSNGDNWESSSISSESEENNVRPIVPVDYDGEHEFVVWMAGEYQDTDDYDMELMMLLPPEEDEDD